MPSSTSVPPAPASVARRTLFCLAFAVAGFVLNAVPLPVFAEVRLHLGGALPIMAAVAYGPIAGALVAAGAYAGCLVAPGQPIVLLLALLEATCVGLLVRRHAYRPWTAMMIFWGCVGTPLAAWYHFKIAAHPFPINWVAVIALVVNAGLNTLVYLPFLYCRCFWRNTQSTSAHYDRDDSLRGLLLSRLLFTGIWPLIVLTLFAGYRHNQRELGEFKTSLSEQANEIAAITQTFSRFWKLHLQYAAEDLAGGPDTPAFRRALIERVLRRDFESRWIVIADERGDVIAAAGDYRNDKISRIHLEAAQAAEGAWMESHFDGEIFGQKLTQTVGSSYRTQTGERRFVVAEMDLSSFATYISHRVSLRDREFFIVDSTRTHVLTNSRRGAAGFDRAKALQTTNESAIADDVSDPDSFAASRHYGAAKKIEGTNGTVYVRAEFWPEAIIIAQTYFTALLLIGIVAAIAVLIGLNVSRSLSQPFLKLVEFTAALSRRQPTAPLQLDGPVVAEWRGLSLDLVGAAQHLAETNRQLEQAVADRDQAVTRLQALTNELDDRVRVRTAELDAARIAAENASQAKSDFLATVSHELRTPLNVVLGHTFLLLRNPADPLTTQQSERVARIRSSTEHLLTLINEILDLAKLSAGRQQLRLGPVNLAALGRECADFFRDECERSQLALESDFAEPMPSLLGDAKRLKQILLNLLGNAVKFTPVGGSIGLKISAQPNGDSFSLEVWDTGIGISTEEQQRLFRPFEQVDNSRNRKYAGTGLGLAIVKHLTDLHHGTITVISSPGQGSRFVITLPASPPTVEV